MLHVCPKGANAGVAHDREQRRAVLQTRLCDLLAGSILRVPDPRFEIVVGMSADEILKFAAAQKVDLIILGLKPAHIF